MDKPQFQTLKSTTTSRQKTLILNALHKSSLHRRRSRRRVPTSRIIADKIHRNHPVFTYEEADDKEAVERKIRALQSIVPGGESLGVDKLFEQTAEYIMNLQHQVKAMRALSSFFESLEKEKSECGG
ncbi:transcription factor PAR2-like [Cucumis melo]|uniref:Transcription factor PAR2-like n=1 Tax=Cucumis melo TaxID=3656 RepID=A0A1S3BM86_CUCME|nr:transcription factor PAR2-like [Cucumis melo]